MKKIGSSPNKKYNPTAIESKWRKTWQEKGVYQPDLRKVENPFYNLMMFPYSSAEGLHVGNVYAFTGSDIYGRFKRMQGYQVFEPIGLDGFGIHSENYAIKVGRNPAEQAKISQKNFYRQLRSIGNSFAWKNSLETYDPDYYKWTQWIFIQLFKAGLAYRKKAPVNFCPSCKTVLSDEQVIAGACERCKTMVVKKELTQWFFKITKYAERLLENLDSLKEGVFGSGRSVSKREKKLGIDWSEKVKIAQRNWIGKKEGINIDYPVVDEKSRPVKFNGQPLKITCFTTRPDTNFGATFVVLAPEHEFVEKLLALHPRGGRMPSPGVEEKRKEILDYVEQAKKKTPIERIAEGREKTGIFTGLYCLNQLNNYKMPLFISDFVLMEFGTGAVVGVPGHDRRDFEFAQKFSLPIKRVVIGKDGDKLEITRIEQVQEEEGVMINSDFLNSLDIHQATKAMMDHIEEKKWGKRVTSYRLRDWCISRQRYWGPPIPMVYCQACAEKGISWWDAESGKETPGVGEMPTPGVEDLRKGGKDTSDGGVETSTTPRMVEESRKSMAGWFPVPEDKLPVLLPKVKDWRPEGEGKGPLDKIPEFYKTKCPKCGGEAKRETDVSDTFLDSAWYFLRYPSVETSSSPSSEVAPQCGDSSDGGTTGRSLPWDPKITKRWLPVDMYIGGAEHSVLHLLYSRFLTMVFKDLGLLDFEEPFRKFRAHGLLISEGAKMSKSRGNIVIPDQYIKKYGADTLRMYLMFLGPFTQGGDFRDVGIRGIYRFLERVWRMVTASQGDTSEVAGWSASGSHDSSDGEGIGEQKALNHKRLIHRTIKKVTEDIENLSYNTAIAALMEYVNKISKSPNLQISNEERSEAVKTLLLLLAPFVPYITEELWQGLKGSDPEEVEPSNKTPTVSRGVQSRRAGQGSTSMNSWSIHTQPWPKYDEKWLKEEQVSVVIEVNGKVRGEIKIKNLDWQVLSEKQKSKIKSEIEERAKEDPKVKKYLEGRRVERVVFIPGRLINFVTNGNSGVHDRGL